MLESIVTFLQSLPPWGVLGVTFLIAYIENLFPPSPSDVLLVFCGTIVGIGTVGFVPMLIMATLGSVTGFSTAYWLGRKYGTQIAEKRWVPFLNMDTIGRVQHWFDKYHGLIIVVNRFLSGTRAVISFAAGITAMPFPRTVIYCTISAAVWNALMILLGMQFGSRWRDVDQYLSTYGTAITILLVAAVVGWFVWKWWKKRRTV